VLAYAAASLIEGFALAAAAFVIPVLAKSADDAGFAKVFDFVGASLAVGALPKKNASSCGGWHVATSIPARTINRHCKHMSIQA
jgi:hypothetical protein